jgi:serine/threonine-protein kinase
LALRREVALKVLDEGAPLAESMRERFLAEARILAGLDHPNIVRIFSVDKEAGRLRLGMELVKGHTLSDLVRRDGPLAAEEAARIGTDLCRALAAIHAKGLVHMDVKPGNVMRAGGGRIVLLDFGFTRASAGATGGPLGGTPYFCAPEQLEGRDSIGPVTDIYALGVTLYWLVSGRYPHEAKDYFELRRVVLREPPRPLLDVAPDVPAEYAAIVSRAIRKDAKDRFASAGAFEEALQSFLAGRGSRRPTERRALAPLVAGLVGALLVALAALLFFRPRPAQVAAAAPEVSFDLFAERGGEDVLLEPDDRVREEERLFMEVRAEVPIHLYVFNEDQHGTMHTLFPTPSSEVQNPLAIDGAQRLPASGVWIVTTPGGGAEYFHVVASVEPVPSVAEIASLVEPVTWIGMPADVRGRIESGLRGVGATTETPATDPPAPFASLGQVLAAVRERVPGVSVETLRLAHP